MPSSLLGAVPVYAHTPGSPYQATDIVRVVANPEKDEHVKQLMHRYGLVHCLEYEGGVGQSRPEDPMICVRFSDGKAWQFWREELCLVKRLRKEPINAT